MTEYARVGIAGVGLMGHGICHQLLERDYPVSVLGHKRRERIDDVVAAGAVEAPDIAALTAASDVDDAPIRHTRPTATTVPARAVRPRAVRSRVRANAARTRPMSVPLTWITPIPPDAPPRTS